MRTGCETRGTGSDGGPSGCALNSPQGGGPGTKVSNLAAFEVINSNTGWRTVMTSLRVRF